jgi:hypothetical protein
VSASFKIRSVRLIAAKRSYEWRLTDGVNVVAGPVGVGKTSLLELIHFGLGGNALLSEAVLEVGRQLALNVEIAGEPLLFLRGITSNKSRVIVHRADGTPLATAHIGNPQAEDSISHLLMSRLGIPEVRVPRSRRNPAGRHTAISFNDVFNYMYLPQTEIDRSTVNHLEGVRDPKRRSTFELLYGLIDPQTARLQVEIGNLATEIEQAQSAVREIDGFVANLEVPSRAELEQRIRSAHGMEETLHRELHSLRQQMRSADSVASPAVREAEELSDRLSERIASRERATAQVENLERLRSQVVLDEQRTTKAMLAGAQLAAIEFRTCPRCLQRLPESTAEIGHCMLCHQPEPATLATVSLEDEFERVRGQLTETDMMLADAQQQAMSASKSVEELRIRATDARRRADEQAREAVAPFVDVVARLSEQLGELRSQRAAAVEALDLHIQLERRHVGLNDLQQRQEKLAKQLALAQTDREEAMTRVEELSDAFDEILRDFKLPWYQHSEIDRKTYLPMVGGKRLEQLSSGGMKTLVNDAYFLAGFSYALRVPTETLLPGLMVIDTPRKNFGSNVDDSSTSNRIYRWLWTLQRVYGASAFQLIVADNDIPPEAQQFNLLRFSYDAPLIDDLPHPGPDRVKTLGSS